MLRVLIATILAGALGAAFAGEPSVPDDADIREAREATRAAIDAANRSPLRPVDALPSIGSASTDGPSASPTLPFAADPAATAEIRALMERARADTLTDLNTPPAASPRPLVFVSLSVPETSLRALLEQSRPIGASLVLRGLVDDSMQRTAERLAALLGVDADAADQRRPSPDVSLTIDPTLFERFQIDAVPAFVVPLEAPAVCTTGGACPPPVHAKLAGDVTLPYALEVIARDAANPRLRSAAAEWLGTSGSAK